MDQHPRQSHQQRGLPGVPDRQLNKNPWVRFLMEPCRSKESEAAGRICVAPDESPGSNHLWLTSELSFHVRFLHGNGSRSVPLVSQKALFLPELDSPGILCHTLGYVNERKREHEHSSIPYQKYAACVSPYSPVSGAFLSSGMFRRLQKERL